MKKTIGLGLLLLTGLTAFAAPAAAAGRFHETAVRKEIVVVKRHKRVPVRRVVVRTRNVRFR